LNSFHYLLKAGAFTTKRLGIFRLIPDSGIFQFSIYLNQTFKLGIEVKGTPSEPGCALEDL